MSSFGLVRVLSTTDLKNIRRDPLLAWLPLSPLLMTFLFRFGLPALQEFVGRFGLELAPYYPLFMSSFMMLAPTLIGMVIGFLLLDERDDRTLQALQVTPVPLPALLAYRLSFPMLLGFLVTLLCYPLAGISPLPLQHLFFLALLSAVNAPLTALLLLTFAENKVAGFAVLKMLNTVMLLPVAAYFVGSSLQYVAGIIPTYWGLKALWLAANGQSYALVYGLGIVSNGLLLALLQYRYLKTLR